MRAFHHRVDRHRELFAAIVALVDAQTMLLALKPSFVRSQAV